MNIYNNINIEKYYTLLLLVILLLVLFLIVPYNKVYHYTLYVNNNYKLVVDDNYFPIKNKSLYIEGKKYSYSVLNISEPYLTNNKKYYEVEVSIDLKDYEKEKNIISIVVIKGKTTVLKNIIKKVKGW